MNIASYLEQHATSDPDRVAVRFEGCSLSYGELNGKAARLADALRARGIGSGDRVALYLPNLPEFLVVYFAAQKLGAIAVTINSSFKTEEVRYLLDDSASATVFTTAELSKYVPADCVALKLRVSVDENPSANAWVMLSELLSTGSDTFASASRESDDEAALLYSSGTTGIPKGVILTQHNIHTNVALCAMCSNYRPGERIATFLPLFHMYGQNYIMNAAIFGYGRLCQRLLHHRARAFALADAAHRAWRHRTHRTSSRFSHPAFVRTLPAARHHRLGHQPVLPVRQRRIPRRSHRHRRHSRAEHLIVQAGKRPPVLLLGPNGAGKTTLFNLISGAAPASGGEVQFLGRRIEELEARHIAELGMSRTFQHARLLPAMSVLENAAIGAHLRGNAGVLPATLHLERAEEAQLLAEAARQLDRVGLGEHLHEAAGSLPLG